jgi:predicted Mrr-cat superfamily restriction endonuclease
MAKDFLGNDINVGDKVVFMQVNYRGLMIGKIVSLSKQKAKLKHEMTNTCSTETTQYHNQMIKILK